MDFISGLRRKISNPRAKVKRICLETGCVKKLRKLIRLNADLNIEKMRFVSIFGGIIFLMHLYSRDDHESFLASNCRTE